MIDLNPRVVVILAGTNDIAWSIRLMTDQEIEVQTLKSMAELAKAHGIRVVLSSILPTSARTTRRQTVSRKQSPA